MTVANVRLENSDRSNFTLSGTGSVASVKKALPEKINNNTYSALEIRMPEATMNNNEDLDVTRLLIDCLTAEVDLTMSLERHQKGKIDHSEKPITLIGCCPAYTHQQHHHQKISEAIYLSGFASRGGEAKPRDRTFFWIRGTVSSTAVVLLRSSNSTVSREKLTKKVTCTAQCRFMVVTLHSRVSSTTPTLRKGPDSTITTGKMKDCWESGRERAAITKYGPIKSGGASRRTAVVSREKPGGPNR
ncbi:hypothetical protein GALMADRAFT_216071 [Galerina marginata CBS 339.88]|uniref:Uncharacterized protein n=1 Tax=Galerina marginata (strain CBS 339.88) TaxID=685588 RepID=A0A067SAM6_GALM3|nr:hypothetical protein GALMADRAFT_216071 [Galerina marginata CBS 339.88]